MGHLGENAVDYVIIAVGLVSLALAGLALRAYLRTRDARLMFLVAAFGVMVLKQALTAYSVVTGYLEHNDLELANSLLDLVVVTLLVLPLFVRRR